MHQYSVLCVGKGENEFSGNCTLGLPRATAGGRVDRARRQAVGDAAVIVQCVGVGVFAQSEHWDGICHIDEIQCSTAAADCGVSAKAMCFNNVALALQALALPVSELVAEQNQT